MCFEIRKAALRDMGPALQLDQEVFGADAWTVMDYMGVFSDRQIKKFTARTEGKFAGFAAVMFDREAEAGCLLTIAVRPEYRGRGIGASLLENCLQAFPDRDFYLNVDIENQAAIRLYERAGFQRMAIEPSYYLNGHDALIMEKRISHDGNPTDGNS